MTAYTYASGLTINIDRIEPDNKKYVDNVLVIWRAKSSRGSVVIGWYENARVYKKQQNGNSRRYFEFDGEEHFPGYLIRTKAKDALLIPVQHRIFSVPVTHKGFGSQTFVSFLQDTNPELKKFKKSLAFYISRVKEGDFSSPQKGRKGKIDHETKIKIEKTAVDMAVDYYIQRGYDVESVESENVGYDLLAQKNNEKLYIEVKGTSALNKESTSVNLTANEYKVSKRARNKYRICIVVNALASPELHEYEWNKEMESWFSEQSLTSLIIKESVSAFLEIQQNG